jgi:hypothetical protein
MPEEGVKRTSLDLPVSLWKRVKVRAVEENTEFRRIVIEALEAYLAKGAKKGGSR